jgi:hypothetical protein
MTYPLHCKKRFTVFHSCLFSYLSRSFTPFSPSLLILATYPSSVLSIPSLCIPFSPPSTVHYSYFSLLYSTFITFLSFLVSGSSRCNFEPLFIHHFYLFQKFSRILQESTTFLLLRRKERRGPHFFDVVLLPPQASLQLSLSLSSLSVIYINSACPLLLTAEGDDSQNIIPLYLFLPPFQAVQWIVPLQREIISKERPGMRGYLIIYIWDDKPMMESKCLPKLYSHK